MWTPPFDAIGKYSSFENTIKIVGGRSLIWSRPTRFNDPFDCDPRFNLVRDGQAFKNELLNIADVLLSGNIDPDSLPDVQPSLGRLAASQAQTGRVNREFWIQHIIKLADEILGSIGRANAIARRELLGPLQETKISCFTKAFYNIPMWSHYADNHRGALLLFAPRSPDSQLSLPRPVRYSDELPVLYDEKELAASVWASRLPDEDAMARRVFNDVVYWKTAEWSYEDEWRVHGGNGWHPAESFELVRFNKEDLLAVIFGCKADLAQAKYLRSLAKPFLPHLQYYVCQQERDQAKIRFVPFLF